MQTDSAALYGQDAYLQEAQARVTAHLPDGGLVLDRSLFYPTGGGQPGDTGRLAWAAGTCRVDNTVKGTAGGAVLICAADDPLPPIGAQVSQQLDWQRRYGHMRVHTALHLLSVAVPFEVSGGAITASKGRLDFNMPEAPADKQALQDQLQELINRDLEVTESWISEAELDAKPQLVKTMSVSPPRGAGSIRLVQIGSGAGQVDLQPCGGTHVKRSSEIGQIRIGKMEKKGKQNRRIYLHLVD
ncbi:alanyl-tRNA editing protein [Pseudophaeobacter sp.]|uniref:alanyl-tRNA editing protein n=1 Tax=Pseudophaeobacter sp. TaxID=1971739 RepID=UPI003A9829C7